MQQPATRPRDTATHPLIAVGFTLLAAGLTAWAWLVTRDGRDDGPEDGRVWPFLRLAVDGSVVVLDARQVRLLRDDLDEWLSAARVSIAT